MTGGWAHLQLRAQVGHGGVGGHLHVARALHAAGHGHEMRREAHPHRLACCVGQALRGGNRAAGGGSARLYVLVCWSRAPPPARKCCCTAETKRRHTAAQTLPAAAGKVTAEQSRQSTLAAKAEESKAR